MRAPHTTGPTAGIVRSALTASGLSVPLSPSSTCAVKPVMPVIVAAVPAGAFQTPRLLSVAAHTPATAPHGPALKLAPVLSVSTRLG